ncbi:MAG: SDR family NAD(P)-dependent oxidoreductase [Bryobacteraceae bacterium]
MDYQLKGKLAYVSAGAHGIGQAIANLLTKEGASVIVADCDGEALQKNGGAWRATIAADLATAKGVEQAVQFVLNNFGRAPDILINNLGVGDATPFEQATDEVWMRSINVNLMGCVRTCRALVPRMAELGDAAVVNTGSDLSKQPEPGLLDYGSCKAALLYFAKALSKQYAGKVRINVVSPGPVWTRMWYRPGGMVDQLAEQYGTDKDTAVKRFLQDRQMPLGIAQPEDVAYAAVFLASPLAKFITGANLDIGGTLRGLI